MTNKKKEDNVKVIDNKVKKDDTNELKEKNQQLEAEINEMKLMMKQILELQSKKQTESDVLLDDTVSEEVSNDDYIEIPPNKQINITSLYYGGMTLYGANKKKIRFERFGVTRPVSFEDLTYICTEHRELAESGAFFIHNKEAVRSLYLEQSYTKILDAKKIANLMDLPHDQIESIMKMLNDVQKNTVEYIVIDGIINGDNKYMNYSKLDIINKYCGKNLQKIAQERMDDK